VENAAAEVVRDVRQERDEIAQFAGGRDDGVAELVELLQARVQLVRDSNRAGLAFAAHADEGAVDGVCRAGGVWMN